MTMDPSMPASAEAEATSVYEAIGGRGALTAAIDAGYTTSTAFLEALAEAGVRYIFANLGSDHPGLIEALARARAERREDQFPRLVVCPHETVALSAAHAYASVSRQPQAVLVHVDAGTQNLGGAVSNAMRGRVPVLIFAGAAPYTITGELPAGRNEFIHWIQDAYGAKFPKAAAKITDDEDELLAFYDYPAEHWIHLRTTNPIESTFATVRLRTKVTKGHGSKAAGLAMAFKLIESAQRRWRMVNAPHLVAFVRAGAVFVNGKLVERPNGEAQPEAA